MPSATAPTSKPALHAPPSKPVRRHGLGVRLLNAALNAVLLSVCAYYILDYLYPSPLTRLLSSLIAQSDDSSYADVALNTHLAYSAYSRSTLSTPVANCPVLLSSLGMFDAVQRIDVSLLTSTHFQLSLVQSGRPLLVTGVGASWPISNMSLTQLRDWIGDDPLTKRAARGTAGRVRGLTVFDWFGGSATADTLNSLLDSGNRPSLTSAYYYSWLNAAHNRSLLAAGLYATPSFLGEQPWVGEWLYIGGLGTGVTPHIDRMCLAKWSYQVSGCKRWTLASSTPRLHSGWPARGVQADVCAGDTLVFWPDHVHSTVCTNVSSGDGACVSLNAYILLDERNCYVQSMIDNGLSRHGAGADVPSASSSSSFVQVKSAATASSTWDAPLDYMGKCPQRFVQLATERRRTAKVASQKQRPIEHDHR